MPAAIVADLQAESWAHLGNILRILDEFAEAEECFERAEALLKLGSQDPILWSEIYRRKGVFLRDKRLLDQAQVVGQEAVRLAEKCGQLDAAGKARLALARTFHDLGRPDAALQETVRASSLLDLSTEPTLSFAVVHSSVLFLAEAGRSEEGLALLTWAEDLYSFQRDPIFRLRTAWMRGRLFSACGRLRRAAALLEGVRKGFRERQMIYDSVLATLDLCLVWAKAERPYKVNELSRQIGEMLESPAIPAQAVLILEDFEERASHWKVDAAFVEETLARLDALGR